MILTRPSSISEHFAVVPPTSSEMTFGSSMSLPSSAAPQTPEAGPDSTIVIGVRDTESRESTPQFDCMTYKLPPNPLSSIRDRSRFRYLSATGWTYADRTAVLVRSYSRHSLVT